MSQPKYPESVKLISSIFSNNKNFLNTSIEELSNQLGLIDYISEFMSFDYTDYYEKEMGISLVRRFISFENLVRPESLPDVKHITDKIEKGLSREGKRQVNIDPGYLSQAHLILATGKGYTHRPYLRDGIYADLTLIYRDNTFQSLDWTYPDYSGKEITGMLSTIRKKYIIQLRRLKKDDSSQLEQNIYKKRGG